MKPTDFSKSLTDLLSKYLPGERGLSTNTIESYKTTFILFITFMEEKRKIQVNKLAIKDISKECVVAFLEWLQSDRHCSTATRNVRLAALHSFFRYLQYELPENLYEWQQILSVKAKKTSKKSVNYLTIDGIKLLLQQPDQSTPKGATRFSHAITNVRLCSESTGNNRFDTSYDTLDQTLYSENYRER